MGKEQRLKRDFKDRKQARNFKERRKNWQF
jgi:hypothetical protein